MRGRNEKKQCKRSESDSEFPVCDVCGQNHSTESCIFISARPCTVEDAVTPTHARLTLPANLAVKDLADGSTTIVTKAKFARGTRFGPYIAPLTSILPPEVNFPLKIFGDSEEDSFYLDTRNEDDCNWMCLVGSISSNDTQNLLCYQVHDKIFFSLLHDVEPGEELRVWYAPFYGIKMGISPGRFASVSSTAASEALEMSEELIKSQEPVAWEADTTTGDILPPEEQLQIWQGNKHQKEEKKQLFNGGVQQKREINNDARAAYVAQQLPPKRLGARFTPACWRCRECGAKEESVISYARHLMQHLRPRSKKVVCSDNDKRYSCTICNQKFFSQGLLDDHKATQHDLSDLMEPVPFSKELGETSVELDDPLPMKECTEEESHLRAVEPSLNVLEKSSGSFTKDEKSSESEGFLTVPCVQQTCDMDPFPKVTTNINENSPLNGNMDMNCNSILATSNDNQQDIRTNTSAPSDTVPLKSSVTFQENTEKLEENCRKLVAVMGENALQNLLIPIDQQKDIDLLLQSFQQPTREKPVTHPAKVPETILNHEFFTRVAGDTVVRDVKSLLSMGYSLQFLVENEDGSSSLVDVLSTGSGVTTDSVTSSASQNGEVSSQQLVIMANGNVPDSLPQALQGILPPSVPIVPSVVDPIVSPQSPLLANSSADIVTHDSTAADVQLPCLSEDSFLNKQNSTSDARSPLGTLLPSAITNNMCYDNVVSYTDSNSENASLIEMSLSSENLDRGELDYELGALELPLAVDDTNSTDYMINTCTSLPLPPPPPPAPAPPPPPPPPPPLLPQASNTVRSSNLCMESNPDLNTPVKMLDQCIDSTLPTDVMTFDFEASNRTNILRSPLPEEKNGVCREELTKDFSDLIAADAESSNVMLTIQPADSTAELRKDDSVSSIELRNVCEKEKPSTSLEWMGSEGLLLTVQDDSMEHVPQTLVLKASEQSSAEIGFQTVTGGDIGSTLLKDNTEETRLLQVTTTQLNAELDGLLVARSNSPNAVPVMEMQSNLEPHLKLQSKDQMQSPSELHLQLHCQPPGASGTPFHQQAHSQVLSQAENQQWLTAHTKISTPVHTQYQTHSQTHKQNIVQSQAQMKTDTEAQAQMEFEVQAQTLINIQTQHQSASEKQQELHPSPDLAAAADTEMEVEQSFISSGPPYICDICNKSFGKMAYLYRHLRKHTGEFTCVACCAVFARKETLQLHDCPAQPTRSRGNSLVLSCPFCRKMFPEKRQLTRHLVSHTGSRRYQCTICGNNFTSKEAAVQHIRKCSSKSSLANEQSQPLSLLVVQEGASATPETKAQNSVQLLRCKTCRRMFSSEATLRRHEMTEHQDSTKDCTHCGRALTWATPERVELHTRICAPAAALQAGNADTAICPECNEPFRQLLLYRQHVYRHTHPFSCAHCHRSFRTLQERGKHVCLDLLEQCCQCGHRFGTVPQLERHALTHGVPHYHCYECGRSFHLMTDFKHHRCFELNLKVLRRAPKKEDPSVTQVVSSSSPKRNRSQRTESEEVLMCEICGEVYRSRWALKAHHLLHGEREIECGICGKLFHRKDGLVEHMYVHEEAQLRCTICDKLLKSKKSLDAHIRQQHCNNKQFVCPHCNKEFHQKVNLLKHIKSHEKTQQRQPVNCTHCGQCFQFPGELAKHMAEHTDTPGFQCTHCDRTFLKEKSLSQHMKLHGPRPHASRGFSCPACGHTLKHRNSLRRHIIKNHPELTYRRRVTSEYQVEPTSNNVGQPQSPEVLLTVSQLQLTTDGVQQVSLPEGIPIGNACLLEEEAMECSEEMVLYVLQEPLSCLPLQEPSS